MLAIRGKRGARTCSRGTSLKYRKYASHYLAAFTYRFNRRFDLRDLVVRLIVDVARCVPFKESVVRQHAEAGF
jgi:hypothetical protein